MPKEWHFSADMKSDKEWVAWGRRDPLYAVSTWQGRDKNGEKPWTKKDFYALGESDWADFFPRWRAYGLKTNHVLEVGCGAGRITRQLVKCFDRVSATDVSCDQIALAQKAVQPAPVSFLISDGTNLELEDSSVTAVFSCHVFQHFDSVQDAFLVFNELHRILEPGASLCIHLPLFVFPASPLQSLMRTGLKFQKAISQWRATLRRAFHLPLMRRLSFEIGPLTKELGAMGFESVEFCMFHMKSNRDLHPVLFATKALNTF